MYSVPLSFYYDKNGATLLPDTIFSFYYDNNFRRWSDCAIALEELIFSTGQSSQSRISKIEF
jgi:hypothetical protein